MAEFLSLHDSEIWRVSQSPYRGTENWFATERNSAIAQCSINTAWTPSIRQYMYFLGKDTMAKVMATSKLSEKKVCVLVLFGNCTLIQDTMTISTSCTAN